MPDYEWDETGGASWYQLKVNENGGGDVILGWYQVGVDVTCASSICTPNPGIILPNDVYDWTVQPWTGAYGSWYGTLTFTVNADVPELLYPAGTVTDSTPLYEWEETSGASWYQLQVDETGGSNVILGWYQVGVDVNCSGGTCSLDPNVFLLNDTYDWRVQPWTGTYGIWYGKFTFTVDAPIPPLLSPTNGSTVTVSTPNYQWQETGGASWYYLHVEDDYGNQVIGAWYQVGVDVTCSGGVCTLNPGIVLPDDSLCWWTVQPWLGYYGNWYDWFYFDTDLPGIFSLFTDHSNGWAAHSGSWNIEYNEYLTGRV
ncbi:MAG: hypothetical protein B6I38_03805 [Anaerolineaceae bacterium 4572_5.1]|nr:MAG: hypothetical protein B6I38_03805 [Anaerolineaceae bacterium 4572_5.1]